MIERWVKPLHAEWPNDGVGEAIQIWERDNGVQLPNDYRSFMTRHNGGRCPTSAPMRQNWLN